MIKDYEARKRIGGLLRAARLKLGMSQQEMARITGFTQANIANVELGKYGSSIDVLSAMAKAVGCHVSIEPGDPPAFLEEK